MTYDRETNDMVRHEVIIHRGKIVSTTLDELNLGLNLKNQAIRCLDSRKNLLHALLENRGLALHVLHYRLSRVERSEGSNVVQRRRRRKDLSRGSGEEFRIDLLKRHDEGLEFLAPDV